MKAKIGYFIPQFPGKIHIFFGVSDNLLENLELKQI